MERKNILWGILLVIVGTLFLFDYYELIDFSFSNLLRLWPLLLIIWGISILPIKKQYSNIITIALVFGGLLLASLVPHKSFHYSFSNGVSSSNVSVVDDDDDTYTNSKHYSISYAANDSTLTTAKLDLNIGAGDLSITQPSEQYWLDFEANSNLQDYNGSMTTNGTQAHFIIDSEEEGHRNFKLNNKSKNKAKLRLSNKLLWDIELDAGAVEMYSDLRELRIRSLEINTGASDINISLGTLQKETHLNIDSGASSIDIEIPAAAYCEIKADGFISDLEAPGFIKNDKGVYTTKDVSADTADVQKIYIDIDSAVSAVNIHRK